MKLWAKILIALFLGVIAGLILGPKGEYLRPVGQCFLRLINMVIPLLVLSSMTAGISAINDPQKLGRVGLRTLVVCFGTTLFAVGVGVAMGNLFRPGLGMGLQGTMEISTRNMPGIVDIFMDLIPGNPVDSLAKNNVMQIIVFSLFLGMAINLAGEKGKPLLRMFESMADVMFRMTSMVMEFSPIGVFAIMTWVAGSFGLAVLIPLTKFLMAYYLGAVIHVCVVLCGFLYFFGGLRPLPFFRGMKEAMMVSFSTCSSSAALPVTMHCVTEKLGVSKSIASFVLPLGSTVNMNGAAMFQAMAAIFVAQAYGIDLSWYSLLTLIVAATLAAVGAAGVPGSGLVMLTVTFTAVGLPIEGLAILASIDRIREMPSTTLNVLGDAATAVYVAQKEGELDERQYYSSEDMVPETNRI